MTTDENFPRGARKTQEQLDAERAAYETAPEGMKGQMQEPAPEVRGGAPSKGATLSKEDALPKAVARERIGQRRGDEGAPSEGASARHAEETSSRAARTRAPENPQQQVAEGTVRKGAVRIDKAVEQGQEAPASASEAYQEARRALRNDDQAIERMSRLGDRLDNTFAGVYKEPQEARKAWAKKVAEVGVEDAIKILRREPETLARTTKSETELKRIFQDQEKTPQIVRDAQVYGRAVEQRLKPEERARFERQAANASAQLRERVIERDATRYMERNGIARQSLSDQQYEDVRRLAQHSDRLEQSQRLSAGLAEAKASLNVSSLRKSLQKTARDVGRTAEQVGAQLKRYFARPEEARASIEASMQREGAGRTVRTLGRRPERLGELSPEGKAAMQDQRERAAAKLLRNGHLQGGNELSAAVAKHEVARARQVLSQNPEKAVFLHQKEKEMAQLFAATYRDGDAAQKAFGRAAGDRIGTDRHERAIRIMESTPERFGALRTGMPKDLSPRKTSKAIAAGNRELVTLREGDLKEVIRANETMRQQEGFARRLSARTASIPSQEVLSQRVERTATRLSQRSGAPLQEQAARKISRGAVSAVKVIREKAAQQATKSATRGAFQSAGAFAARRAAGVAKDLALGRDPT